MAGSNRDEQLEASSSSTCLLRFSRHKHTRFKMEPDDSGGEHSISKQPAPSKLIRSQANQSHDKTRARLHCTQSQQRGTQTRRSPSSLTRARVGLKILLTCCALLVLVLMAGARLVNSQAGERSPASDSPTEIEGQLEVLRAPNPGNGQSQREPTTGGQRQSRIYKIRAAPINGKLSLPNTRAHHLTDRLIAHLRPSDDFSPANQTGQPPSSYGLRSPMKQQQQQAEFIKSSQQQPVELTANLQQNGDQTNDCHESQSANIAASSPLLRLTPGVRSQQQVAKRGPELIHTPAKPQLVADSAAFKTQEDPL